MSVNAEAHVLEEDRGLIPISSIQNDALEIFRDQTLQKPEQIVKSVEKIVRSFVLSVETEQGRKEIKALGRKINATSSAIDDIRKSLVEDQKRELAIIDAGGKFIRDHLGALRQEVLKPLNDWQEAEERRVGLLKSRVAAIQEMGKVSDNMDPEAIDIMLQTAQNLYNKGDWEDFADLAGNAINEVAEICAKVRPDAERRKAERIELMELRRKQAEQAAREEAEKKVREEMEAKIKAETERAARAERDAEIAAKSAQKAVEEAAELERQKAEREKQAELDRQKAEREAEEARAKDKERRALVHTEAVSDLQTSAGLSEGQAIAVLKAITENKIRNISISY